MIFLQGRRYLKLMNGQRRLWFAKGVSFVIIATLFLMLLKVIMCGTELFAKDSTFLSLSPMNNFLESKLFRYMDGLTSTRVDLFSIMYRLKYTLASLISFVLMFALTIYLVLQSLRKKGVRRSRVNSCLWTRRRVFWLQRRQSRTAYLLAARESSIKARKCCVKETCQRIEEVSTNYCSNILKIITLAFTAVMAGSELYMVNDLQKHEVNIQSLSNLTLEYRNSGHPLVYRDKVNV